MARRHNVRALPLRLAFERVVSLFDPFLWNDSAIRTAANRFEIACELHGINVEDFGSACSRWCITRDNHASA